MYSLRVLPRKHNRDQVSILSILPSPTVELRKDIVVKDDKIPQWLWWMSGLLILTTFLAFGIMLLGML
jgi:hypothetical protein